MDLQLRGDSMCCVVTVVKCDHNSKVGVLPDECEGCGMMEWLPAFETEEECNNAYIKQHGSPGGL